ncbi:glycoside hydrolase family 97 protein [Pedobacter sp. SYP-B3415]|uniref:glycoside hydrolase family 97 protein n=1 Tax=Pedobacter sp. SYP-B3415 TaxID=2496641 RepID=UPI00101E0504|nr:glycoside hydrolase family 97 protein [Pedobacter sp. SYP-B3415]
MNRIFLSICLAFAFFSASGRQHSLRSPDGKIVFRLDNRKTPAYTVSFRKAELVSRSTLSFNFADGGLFSENIAISKPRMRRAVDKYRLHVGKASSVAISYNEMTVDLQEQTGRKRRVTFTVRAFDDGIAFRYTFPEQAAKLDIIEEHTAFNFSGNPQSLTLSFANSHNSHEGLYRRSNVQALSADSLIDLPALFTYPGKIYVAVTEANLRNYAGMYLRKTGSALQSSLSPLPDSKDVKVRTKLPQSSPWRVMLISDKAGDLLASNILTSLNEPPEAQDWSWLKPGKTSFHWWNGDILPDTTFAPGANFEFNKYYIDFCARNKIEYHSVIGYGGFAWYPSNGPNYGNPGTFSDLTRSVPGMDMQRICDYAKSKGVGIHVWLHWRALYPQIDKAFAQFEKWGIKGMMVDFLDRDDQEMVMIQEEILKKAAKHHLFIQFHGAYKPTGLSRTYPNEFTREGTHNYEQNKWSKKPLDADHDLNIIFTRLLAGATDYHLGGFRAALADAFKTQYTRPLTGGTRGHMLAMYVVLESYLNMVADYPQAYEGQPGFDFLKLVPTTWDETRVPTAEPGSHAAVVRRKGNTWYLGAVAGNKPVDVVFKADFLKQGSYRSVTWQDDQDKKDPNALKRVEAGIEAGDDIRVSLSAGGGTVMIFEKN